MRASEASALTISSRCLRATVRRQAGVIGSRGRESRVGELIHTAAKRRRRHGPAGGERDVFHDGERGHRGRMLVHHADAVPPGVARGSEPDRRPVRPRSRRHRAESARRRCASAWTCRRRSRRERRAPRRRRSTKSTPASARTEAKDLVICWSERIMLSAGAGDGPLDHGAYIPVGCRWNSHGSSNRRPEMLRQRLHPDLSRWRSARRRSRSRPVPSRRSRCGVRLRR